MENALKKFLNPDDPAFNSLEFRGLCLVGFDCDAYPNGPSKTELKSIVNAIIAVLPTWKEHLVKRVSEEKLAEFSMHFLFVPFPSADKFRELFRAQLGLTSPPEAVAAEAPKAAAATIPAVAKSAAVKPVRARNATPGTPRPGRAAKAKGGTPRGAS